MGEHLKENNMCLAQGGGRGAGGGGHLKDYPFVPLPLPKLLDYF